MNTKLQGRWGEAAALEYLQKKGYQSVGMGFRTRFGEIDIIAKNRKYVLFVEVKLRKNDQFAMPREFVDQKKQQRIRDTALIWLSANESSLQPRFDVIEIYAPDGMNTKNPEIIHLENAF